jgi:hypothetical protein
MTLATVSTALGMLLGIISLTGGAIAYLKASTRKAYAAERDMNHFKNNQLQLNQQFEHQADMLDIRLNEVTAKLTEINQKIDFLLNK